MQLFAQAVFCFFPIVRIDKLSNSNPLKSSWVFIMTKNDCAVCLNKLVFINVTIPCCIVVTRSLYRSDHVITSWYSLWWYLSLYPGCADKELVEKFHSFLLQAGIYWFYVILLCRLCRQGAWKWPQACVLVLQCGGHFWFCYEQKFPVQWISDQDRLLPGCCSGKKWCNIDSNCWDWI